MQAHCITQYNVNPSERCTAHGPFLVHSIDISLPPPPICCRAIFRYWLPFFNGLREYFIHVQHIKLQYVIPCTCATIVSL